MHPADELIASVWIEVGNVHEPPAVTLYVGGGMEIKIFDIRLRNIRGEHFLGSDPDFNKAKPGAIPKQLLQHGRVKDEKIRVGILLCDRNKPLHTMERAQCLGFDLLFRHQRSGAARKISLQHKINVIWKGPLREDDPFGLHNGIETYSASKIAAESLVEFLSREEGIPATIIRISCFSAVSGGSPQSPLR